jgi:hypothetical protein
MYDSHMTDATSPARHTPLGFLPFARYVGRFTRKYCAHGSITGPSSKMQNISYT